MASDGSAHGGFVRVVVDNAHDSQLGVRAQSAPKDGAQQAGDAE
jgi:hypothetical protein